MSVNLPPVPPGGDPMPPVNQMRPDGHGMRPDGQRPPGELDAVEDLTSFEVDGRVRAMGRGSKGREKYYIKVKIGGDDNKVIAFHTCSKTLEVAYKMIEVIGSQTKDLDAEQFKNYLNENKGKRIWFNVTNSGISDRVVAYQADEHGHSLQYFIPMARIEHRVREQLRENARLDQSRVDNSVDLNDQPVRLKLKKKGRHPVNHDPINTIRQYEI